MEHFGVFCSLVALLFKDDCDFLSHCWRWWCVFTPLVDNNNKAVSCFCCSAQRGHTSCCLPLQMEPVASVIKPHDVSQPWDVRHTCTCSLRSWGVQGQLDNTVFMTTEPESVWSEPQLSSDWIDFQLISNRHRGGRSLQLWDRGTGGRVIQPYAGGLDTQMSWHLNPAIRYWLFHMCVTLPQELGQSNEPFQWGRGQRQQLQRIHTEPEQVCFSVVNSDLLKPPLMVHRRQKKTHLFTCCDAAAAGRRPINTENTKTHQK